MQKRTKIPEARIAVLLSCKKEIEKNMLVKLEINRDENEITIDGEPLNVMDTENIITAIGRGFSPEKAMLLSDEDYTMCIIPLGKDEKTLTRLRSRIIGEGGKARKTMEDISLCYISVYGKTVSIIGKYENVDITRQAIENLIKGFSHSSVYAFLEKKRKEMKIVKD